MNRFCSMFNLIREQEAINRYERRAGLRLTNYRKGFSDRSIAPDSNPIAALHADFLQRDDNAKHRLAISAYVSR